MSPHHPGRCGAVVLAAGGSSRMGGRNKLLLPVAGVPMVRRVAAAALGSEADPVVVVTGHEADAVAGALAGLAVTMVHNPDFATGLAGSLGRGLEALPEDVTAALVCLGDMPWIEARHLERLLAARDGTAQGSVWVPTWAGRRGNPVLWSSQWFPALMALEGDRGGRAIIAARPPGLREVPMPDDAIHCDIDAPGDLPPDAG
ncbi:MAG: nucleotidyltransferase family protein [Gammaproteobacteria bacterium]|nr:nucleotidyltransferase family protein [Gammaproteobacteria bacterium]